MSKKKITGNYLDMVPAHASGCRYEISEDGKVTIFIENKGIFHRLAQILFHKPRITQIHLDQMGDFIWTLIDGVRSVYDIGELVKEAFGEKAEPLYPRLVQYMRNLQSYEFIEFIESVS